MKLHELQILQTGRVVRTISGSKEGSAKVSQATSAVDRRRCQLDGTARIPDPADRQNSQEDQWVGRGECIGEFGNQRSNYQLVETAKTLDLANQTNSENRT
jgi:hypothetical protein